MTDNNKILQKVVDTITLTHENPDMECVREIALKYLDTIDKKGYLFDLEDIARWLGYRKDQAKTLLVKTCRENKDYKISPPEKRIDGKHGGTNRENIFVTRSGFRRILIGMGPKKKKKHGYIIDYIEAIWDEADKYTRECNQARKRRLEIESEFEVSRRKHVKMEREYVSEHDKMCENACKIFGGIREFQCAVGVVDVLTNKYAIEVKQTEKALYALGQSLGYAFATNRKPAVLLFGPEPSQEIKDLYTKSNVKLLKL